MLRHILLAVDGSPGGRRAADFARQLMDAPGVRLTALVVFEPPQVVPFSPLESYALTASHPSPERLAAAQALTDEITRDLGKDRVHTRMEVGHPADVICQVADQLDVDLIVVGARGLNPIVTWLLGSVSEKVVRHAKRPVTVVR